MKRVLNLFFVLSVGVAFAEPPYAFRSRLLCVHEPDRRDAALRPSANEFAFTDGCVVPDADFAEYLRVSMGVRATVGTEGCISVSVGGADGVRALPARAYEIDVGRTKICIRAADERALRQAYYHLEDLMNLRRAPFLTLGTERRRMRFCPRMIHSGYACDIFPDNYLKLIAHHGFDAIVFYIKDVDKTAAGPNQDVNGLIERARKVGLDTYLYSSVSCFAHPDDPKGKAEIEASFGRIAKAHPGAKGIVFVGESCQFPSRDPRVQPVRHQDINHSDPRPLAGWFPCRDYPDWLRAVMDVLHRYSPGMEIVFWTYNWSRQDAKACADLIPHFPDGVAIQGTLGNGAVTKHDNGLVCTCRDYTVSTTGFTPHYEAQARAAKASGRRFYTMANTAGLTWDYGTAPYLPCPFQWKKRWDGLVDPQYGISGLMETHHFGWYPSFISELAKEAYTEGGIPFDVHLRKIAARDFGEANADRVVEAWRLWSRTEVDYVANNENQYGPFRIGPAFPYNFGGRKILHADFPQDRKAYHAMRWMAILNFPYDLEQAREQNVAYTPIDDADRLKQLELFERMRRDWADGVALLRGALGERALPSVGADARAARSPSVGADPRAARRDKADEMIRVGEWHLHAVETAINLNRGYLAFKRGDRAGVLKYARAEYANAEAALKLAERDSRLGWEPSMEYAAGPEQIRWKLARMRELYGADLLSPRITCYVGSEVGSPDLQALHVLSCDTETGAAEITQAVSGIQGTTYFQLDRENRWLYSAIRERKNGKTVGSLVRFPMKDGRLGDMERLVELPCEAPCHVALSPDGRKIAFAAYLSATAGIADLDGRNLRTYVFPDDAMGTNRKRQKKAYAHQAFFLPDGTLGIVDLGCDRIRFFDPATMAPKKGMDAVFDPGDGPRHTILSKDNRHLFVLNELSSTVTSFALARPASADAGAPLTRIGKWSMLPPDFDRWEKDGVTLATKAAAIKLTADGKILMASNRGHDSIAFYDVKADGTLALRNIAKLTGRFPRDYELLPGEKFMIVGHKMSDEIRVYRFDRAACSLTPVGRPIPVWHPLCFKF